MAKILMLRTCAADMTSCSKRLVDGKEVVGMPFIWPKSGPVECDDWDPRPVCGGGLHGLPWGVGDHERLSWADNAVWMVVEAEDAPDNCVRIDAGIYEEKIKIHRGEVVCSGSKAEAIGYLTAHGGDAEKCVAGSLTASGYAGEATASGYAGKATASGKNGIAEAGAGGSALAGEIGLIVIRWWDAKAERWRVAVGYPGEDGIEAGVMYQVQDGKLVPVPKE